MPAPSGRKRGIAFNRLTLVMRLSVLAASSVCESVRSAQTISTGTFVTGLVEFAMVIAGLSLAFTWRVLGGVLVAIIGGGMLPLSAVKWGRLDSRRVPAECLFADQRSGSTP